MYTSQIKANIQNLSQKQLELCLLMIEQYNGLKQANKLLPGYENDLYVILDELKIASKAYLPIYPDLFNEIEFHVKELLLVKAEIFEVKP